MKKVFKELFELDGCKTIVQTNFSIALYMAFIEKLIEVKTILTYILCIFKADSCEVYDLFI